MNRADRLKLKAKLDRTKPIVLIEALSGPYNHKTHLPGAINILHTLVDELAPRQLPDKGAEIIVYYANLAFQNSEIAAQRLTELGYTRVRDYAEGKQDWLATGRPVERRYLTASAPITISV